MDDSLRVTLDKYGQGHLFKFFPEMNSRQHEKIHTQLREINWKELDSLIRDYVLTAPKTAVSPDISPATYFPASPENEDRKEKYRIALKRGSELLRKGKVAALTVAGGQGTRLGYDGPKGTFAITPVKNKTLFQYFAEKIIRTGKKYGCPLHWFIMTGRANDSQTREFFQKNSFFGIQPSFVHFFTQGTMPAIGLDGKLLLESKESLSLSPNGHGGTLLALKLSGSIAQMRKLGIEHLSYFQVDNPLVSVADPLFIGLHFLEKSEMSGRMLAKTGPFEKLGNFCIIKDRLNIIEYSDMPKKLAEMREADGRLRFIAGSPAIHIISVDFVEKLTEGGRLSLPWHRAEKKVPCIDADGNPVIPDKPNAVKLETFIFDALPLAEKTMILEAKREDEFSPVKNPDGVDSAVSCRKMLVDKDVRRLEKAGVIIPKKENGGPDCVVELSPLTFLDDDDVAAYIAKNGIKAPGRGEKVYYG
ncbi:MAG: UDPGP type 1 family protein [Victivallales bacterium]|jgi:UDP-N-acetylglucosamine/UDP-N-acetylgalactosamine diphosphorylase